MQLWDDLVNEKRRVMVIAATNRPEDVDPAVRRRFERSFHVGMYKQSS
jgi:SpoVK/Ycf46/Vps4 family AAA+-type ATPase